MRALRFLNVTTLCILVAGSVALHAQDEKREPQRPAQQEQPRPEMNQGEVKEPRQEEAKPSKEEKKEQKEQEKQSRDENKADHQMDNRQMDNGQQAHARPAGKSAHIPDNKFHQSFGRSHTFVVQRPVVVQGQPGFVYGGYSFIFIDPWPADWAYTDDCYVDYIDGEYFLFDVLHPGIRIALFVVV